MLRTMWISRAVRMATVAALDHPPRSKAMLTLWWAWTNAETIWLALRPTETTTDNGARDDAAEPQGRAGARGEALPFSLRYTLFIWR